MTQTCVITDIHGMYDMLVQAVSEMPTGCKVICLGDYIDRGPDSAKVVAYLRAKQRDEGWTILKGNHEDMMVMSMTNPDAAGGWLMNGGNATLASYDDDTVMTDDAKWMHWLPTIHEDAHRTYVHAKATQSNGNERIWGRYQPGEKTGWPKHVVHGHTPHKVPEFLSDRTNLDTGACYSGMLSVGVFDDSVPGGPTAVISVTRRG